MTFWAILHNFIYIFDQFHLVFDNFKSVKWHFERLSSLFVCSNTKLQRFMKILLDFGQFSRCEPYLSAVSQRTDNFQRNEGARSKIRFLPDGSVNSHIFIHRISERGNIWYSNIIYHVQNSLTIQNMATVYNFLFRRR